MQTRRQNARVATWPHMFTQAAGNVRLSAYYGELRNVSERKRRAEWAAQNTPQPDEDAERLERVKPHPLDVVALTTWRLGN